jgi:hypothetical protein
MSAFLRAIYTQPFFSRPGCFAEKMDIIQKRSKSIMIFSTEMSG